MSKNTEYKADLNQRYWKYQEIKFSNEQGFFDRPQTKDGRPPVFIRGESWRNVIINQNANQKEIDKLLEVIPDGEKHKWYGSMNSSQALAQSVLGNLAVHNFLHCLSELECDEGMDLFGKAQFPLDNFVMEHNIDYLGEPRPTSLDGYFSGKYQIAIECKFTEQEVGTCSRPRLTTANSNYESDHCNGTYSIQRERKELCPLTEAGVLYWRYVPHLFKWENDSDISPCPLNKNYQLVRNILAAGVNQDGNERNPSFQANGNGQIAYTETREALREPTMLRKCSWQRIVQYLREKNVLDWLTE